MLSEWRRKERGARVPDKHEWMVASRPLYMSKTARVHMHLAGGSRAYLRCAGPQFDRLIGVVGTENENLVVYETLHLYSTPSTSTTPNARKCSPGSDH
jgi:hypothetical protein